MVAVYLCLLLICIASINANNYKLSGQIAIAGLSNVSPSAARIFMDGGKQIAIPQQNGKFFFYNLDVGEHSLEVHLNGFEWNLYLIDVRNDGKIRSYVHQKRNDPLPPQLIIMPLRMAKYVPVESLSLLFLPSLHCIFVQDPKPWNPLNFLKSGPGIMIAIMLVTTVILPKMMEGMDPQQMMAEAQAQQQQQQQSVSNSGNRRRSKKK